MSKFLDILVIFVLSVLAYSVLPFFAVFMGISLVWRKCVNISVQVMIARGETWTMLPASGTSMSGLLIYKKHTVQILTTTILLRKGMKVSRIYTFFSSLSIAGRKVNLVLNNFQRTRHRNSCKVFTFLEDLPA